MRVFFIALILAVTACLSLKSQADISPGNLPDIGDSAAAVLPPEQEQAYGDAIMRQIRRQMPIVYDPLLEDYLNTLAYRLIANNASADRQFQFFMIANGSINAFALPGGYIGVHSGLLQAAENESELAAVLAHEVAHVTQRHIARRIEQSQQINIPALAATIASILVATQNPEAGLAAMQASQAGAMQAMLNFSRAHEREADRVGMQMLARAGLQPEAVASFFEKLLAETRYQQRPPPFLSSHPVTQERIADARNRAKSWQNGPTGRRVTGETGLFPFARLRAIFLTVQDKQEWRSRMDTMMEKHPDFPPFLYAQALGLLHAEQHEALPELLDKLNAKSSDNLFLKVLWLDYLLATKQFRAVTEQAQGMLDFYPRNKAVARKLAEAQNQLDKPEAARQTLRKASDNEENNLAWLDFMSKIQSAAGHREEVFETRARQHFLVGDYEGAVRQLNLALKQTDDFITRQRLKARVDQVRQMQRQESALE